MAFDETFAEAWLNCRHKVFGFRLKPLSIWHKFLIRASEISIFDEDGEVTVGDVYRACFVCCLEYPKTPKRGNRWLHTIRLFLHNKAKETEAFSGYIGDFVTSPEFWDKSGSEKSSKGSAPEELSTVVALMMMGFSEKEAWNMPLGKASWYTTAYASWKGADLDFVTAKEKEMQKNWEKIKAEMEANMPSSIDQSPESPEVEPTIS